MASLLLINPKVRPSKRRTKLGVSIVKKKRRSAAQIAATRKLVAFNHSKKRKSKGVSTVAKKKRSARTLKSVRRHGKPAPVGAFHQAGYARNPIRKRHSKRRHNPIAAKLGLGGIVGRTVLPAAIAAGGALTLDLVWGFLPLPESVKVGPMRHAVKAVGAIGLGLLASMVLKRDTANALASGALTVVMYNAAREAIGSLAPGIALGEYVGISNPQLSEYLAGDDAHQEGFNGIMEGDNDYAMAGADFDF